MHQPRFSLSGQAASESDSLAAIFLVNGHNHTSFPSLLNLSAESLHIANSEMAQAMSNTDRQWCLGQIRTAADDVSFTDSLEDLDVCELENLLATQLYDIAVNKGYCGIDPEHVRAYSP